MQKGIQGDELKRILRCIDALDKPIPLTQLSRLTGLADINQIQFLLCTLEEDGLVHLEKFAEGWSICRPSRLYDHDEIELSEAPVQSNTSLEEADDLRQDSPSEAPKSAPLTDSEKVQDSERLLYPLNPIESLVASEKLDLIQRATDGDTKAWKKLIGHYSPKLRAIARERAKGDFVDLFQIGCIGLIKAIKSFDATKSSNPDPHVSLTVQREINKYIDNNREFIRLSQGVNRAKRKIDKSGKQLHRRLERDPNDHELAIDTLLTEKRVREVNEYRRVNEITSLSEPILETDDQVHLSDAISYECAYETYDNDSILPPELEEVFAKLREKEKLVLHLRYGLENSRVRTLEDIGDLLGVSKQRVKQIESRALSKFNSAKIQQFAQECYGIALNSIHSPSNPAGQIFKQSIDVLRPISHRATKDELFSIVILCMKKHLGHCKSAVLISFVSDKIWLWLHSTPSECEEIAYWTVQHLCFEKLLREAFSGTELVLTERGWRWHRTIDPLNLDVVGEIAQTNNESFV